MRRREFILMSSGACLVLPTAGMIQRAYSAPETFRLTVATVLGWAAETPEVARLSDVARVSAFAPGAVLAPNYFAGFISPTLAINNYNGNGFMFAKRADGARNAFNLQSTYSCRDTEVTTWMQRGTVLCRVAGGKAVSFRIQENVAGLHVGVMTGIGAGGDLTSAVDNWRTQNAAYDMVNGDTLDLTTVPGWSPTYRAGDHYTFGCVGFDLYVKYNGVEIFRRKDYMCTQAGTTAVYDDSNDLIGIGDTTVSYVQPSTPLYSNRAIASPFIDIRDWGAKTSNTTGTVKAGSNQLTVASTSGFAVGDPIIVSVGGESGQGMRGTIGVGGVWPSNYYATTAAQNADISKPRGTWAWAQDTGLVKRFNGAVWQDQQTYQGYSNPVYYANLALPKALLATITAISGSVLTLDTAATVGATNANVYFNNAVGNPFFVLTDTYPGTNYPPFPTNLNVHIPPGNFAIGGWGGTGGLSGGQSSSSQLNKDYIQITGAGNSVSKLFIARGTTSHLTVSSCNHVNISDFAWEGTHKVYNGEINGFMVEYTNDASQAYILYSRSLTISGGSNSSVRNIAYIDPVAYACTFENSTDCWGFNCTLSMQAGAQEYVQWFFAINTSTRGGYQDCTVVSSPKLIKSFETFNGTGAQFIRCGGQNALCSTNSSNGWVYQDYHSTLTEGSATTGSTINSGFYHEPIMNVNANAYPGNGSSGTIMNPILIQTGYAETSNNETLIGIGVPGNCGPVTISGQYPNVSASGAISGGYFQAPDYAVVDPNKPFSTRGAIAVSVAGTGCTITGIRCVGAVAPGADQNGWPIGNIQIAPSSKGATVQNCVADLIAAPAGTNASGNMNNAAWRGSYP